MQYKEKNMIESFSEKEKTIMNIKSYLSKLSMIRVNKTKIKDNYDIDYINTWPLYYDNINIDVMDYIKGKGVIQEKDLFLRVKKINRTNYEKLTGRDKEVKIKKKISLLRSYIEILRVSEKIKSGDKIKITVGYDTKKTSHHELPKNTDDIEKILNIKNKSDIFYGFTTDKGWKAKLKGIDGCFLFHKLNLLNGEPISSINRDGLQSSTKKKERLITNDKKILESIINKSQDNIYKSLGIESWYVELKKYE